MSHNVVPLLELGEHTDDVRLLNLDLPGVPVDRVNVDLTRLERSMHWGGIKLLALGSYEGEGTEYTATNFAMNPDGTISATKSKVATRSRIGAPKSQDLHKNGDYRWRNTAVYFNSTGLAEREPEPQKQVRTLDRSLRANLLMDIGTHELGPKRIAEEVAGAFFVALLIKAVPNFTSEHDLLPTTIRWSTPKAILPALLKVEDMIEKRLFGIDRNLPPKYSTMFSWRIDRAMLASRHLSRRILSLEESAASQ